MILLKPQVPQVELGTIDPQGELAILYKSRKSPRRLLGGKRASADMAGKIFVNYRRGDDAGLALALYRGLEDEFTGGNLFMDVEGHIKPGDDFVEVLNDQVAQCDVLLVVIGKHWADLLTARSGDTEDFVAIEIKAALDKGKQVVPVLVGGASMPRADTLPEAIRPLARRNAVFLRPESFKTDCQVLVTALKEKLAIPHLLKMPEANGDGSSTVSKYAPLPAASRSIESKAQGTEHPETGTIRKRWWTMLVERSLSKSRLHAHVTPGERYSIETSAGFRGLLFGYVVTQSEFAAELWIDRGRDRESENKRIFDQLAAHKDAIESAFGGPLSWERLEGKRACRIRYSSEAGGYRSPEDQWPAIQDPIIAAMVRLEHALKPYIAKLSWDTKGTPQSEGRNEDEGETREEAHTNAESPDALISQASELQEKGDYEGAEPLYRRALAINEKVLGPEHPDTATCLDDLTRLLKDLKREPDPKKLLSRGDILSLVGLAKAVVERSAQSTLTPESILAGAALAHQQGRLYESVPLLDAHAAQILEAAQQTGLKVGDITKPLSSKTFPLDERVKAAIKTNARGSVESFLTSLMPCLSKSP